MENGSPRWGFRGNDELNMASEITIRGMLNLLMRNLNEADHRTTIPLGHGDPSVFPCFRTTSVAEDAIADAVRSGKFNGYSSTVGILPARRAIAEYLSQDLPYKLSADDVYLTLGCTQAIEVILSVLARPKANILLPRPGFPYYEARCRYSHLEFRHFDLLPEKGWEVDLDQVEALADENTVAMVIVNPGNPCGNVFTYQHLKKDSVLHTYKKSIQLVFQILKVKRWLVRFKMTSDDTMFIAGVAVGLKNWLRITFAIEPSSLKEGLERIKAFYQRHAKKQ
ncbi:unnamed protein product [Ilex paraguariensis]|uniref:Aminotransferase class I/classII large domain-containing protein n=1 Tax=Ilex paraguariensis TaxID=185542 RepID=A0ABC8UXH0_9AQUA